MIKEYTLTKMSEEGFELKTSDLHLVKFLLHFSLCDQCIEECNYEDNNPMLSIDNMLATQCGAEFIFEEEEIDEN